MQPLLKAQRQRLSNRNILMNEALEEDLVELEKDSVRYKNITAGKIIYANGIQAAASKFWKGLPFVENKGQALIVEIEDLDAKYIYKFGHLSLIPFAENKWWAGSSNELSFQTTAPTGDFKKKTVASLKSVLKKDFRVIDHWSGLRPATVERRPFVGLHPVYPQLAILNGMGSKGCSLAPWFAQQLSEKLIHDTSIDATADVQRFAKILSRN
jgi:glycine/D-amino acid oxidase-like deaminating enzyme